MPTTLQDFLKAQDAAVLDSFIDLDWCYSAVTSAPRLADQAARFGRSVHPLGDRRPEDARVVRHGSHAELWVRARLSGYTRVFLEFAHQELGFTASSVPAGYNVDHLFSRGRVQTPSGLEDDRLPVTTMVLMLLVSAPVNKSFGSLMEGAMIGTGVKDRPYRRFEWLQLAKALSINANLHGGGLGGANVVTNMGHVVAEMEKRGVLTALGMSREDVATALLLRADTVTRMRRR